MAAIKEVEVWTDYHKRAPNVLKNVELPTVARVREGNIVFLGDIFDLSRCKYDDVGINNIEVDTYLSAMGDRYIIGNHEKRFYKGLSHNYLVINKTVFAHGDLESNFKKWHPYRLGKQGSGFIGRLFSRVIDFAEEFRESIDDQKFIKAAYAIAKAHDCTTYVCGHFHVPKKIEIIYKGITIVILPRGMSLIAV